jgi:SEA/GATOR complex protein SEA2/WDR24
MRISDTQTSLNPDHKSAVGRGGHRLDASRNLWTGSGLKMESVSTDVAWGRGSKSQP